MRPFTDRAEALLRATPRVSVPLAELAVELGVEGDALAAALDADARFALVQPAAFPRLSALDEAERHAYATAFRAAGLEAAPSVVLTAPDPDPGGPVSVDRILRETVTRVLARSGDPVLAAAAERLRRAVVATDAIAGTAPSTTPPPGRSGPAPAPPRRRPTSPPRPPYPGSPRG